MAGRALQRIPGGRVVRVVRVVVVVLMAGRALRAQAVVDPAAVAGAALLLDVRPSEREIGSVVVEVGAPPCLHPVAGRAVQPEPGLHDSGGWPVIVGLVAGGALGALAGKCAVPMAIRALLPGVSAVQRKPPSRGRRSATPPRTARPRPSSTCRGRGCTRWRTCSARAAAAGWLDSCWCDRRRTPRPCRRS